MYHLGEFYQIHNLGACGDNNELIKFWGTDQRWVKKSTFRAILSQQNIKWW